MLTLSQIFVDLLLVPPNQGIAFINFQDMYTWCTQNNGLAQFWKDIHHIYTDFNMEGHLYIHKSIIRW